MIPTKKLTVILLLFSFAFFPLQAANTLTSLQSDTFTRANAPNLGANWGAVNNNGGCQIASNFAKPTSTAQTGFCFFSSADWPNDQAAQATLGLITTLGTDLADAVVRGQFPMNGPSGYIAGSYNTNTNVHLLRANGSCCTDLTSAGTVAQGDVIQLVAVGCNPVNLTVFQNGVSRITFTDSSASQICAGSPGILVFSPANVANVGVTNWTGYAVSNPPTVNNTAPFPVLTRATSTNLGNLTGASQALQFTLPSSVSRIQIIVGSASGTAAAPAWSLECSQDSGTSWFGVPAQIVPNAAPQLGDIFPIYTPFYDVFGLGGASCRFGLGTTSGTVTGTLPVWVVVG